MEKIIDFYLNNEMGEEVVIGWLQGAVISEMERPEECIDLTTISASSFAEQFTDKLHQSLDWLLKQTVNVPINRTPLTVVNKKSSTINENFQVNCLPHAVKTVSYFHFGFRKASTLTTTIRFLLLMRLVVNCKSNQPTSKHSLSESSRRLLAKVVSQLSAPLFTVSKVHEFTFFRSRSQ